jgi:hypothetical protein
VALGAFIAIPAHAQTGTTGTYSYLTVTGTAAINFLDIQGNSAIIGSWITNTSQPGVTFTYFEGTGGTSASFTTTLTRPVATENWLRLDGSGNAWPVMELDQSNQLVLTGSQTSGAGSIVIDPTVGQITVNGNQVLTSGSSLYISSSGLVGIGETSPTEKLEVNGSVYFEGTQSTLGIDAAPVGNIALYESNNYSGTTTNVFGFYDSPQITSYNYGYTGYFTLATYSGSGAIPRISGFEMGNPRGSGTKTTVSALYIDALTAGVTNYGVYLSNTPNGGSLASSGSTNITIIPGVGGSIGFNVANPIAMLDVSSSSTMVERLTNTAAPGAASGAGISSYTSTLPTAASQRVGYYTFGANDSGTGRNAAAIQAYSSQAWVSGSAVGAYMTFSTTPNNSLSRVEALRIAQNGYVGVGTTNPQAELDVNGGIHLSGTLDVSGSNVVLVNQAGDLSMGPFTAGTPP